MILRYPIKWHVEPRLLKTYNELFDQAEEAVAGDTVLLRRVQLSRLPLQYSELEIARTQVGTDKTKIRKLLGLFDRRYPSVRRHVIE